MRTAYANGFGSVSAMARAFGAKESLQPFAWQMKHSKLVIHLASYEHLNGHRFHASFYTQLGRTSESPVEIMGLVVPAACIRTDAYSFCPDCIKTGTHSSILDLCWLNHCPQHDCALESACPECHRSIRWTQLSGAHCMCGFDLSKTPKNHSYSASSHRLLSIFRKKDQSALDRFIFALRALRDNGHPEQTCDIHERAARIADRDETIFEELVLASKRLYPCLPLRPLLAPWLVSQDPWINVQVQHLLQSEVDEPDANRACRCSALELYQDEMISALKISPTKLRSFLTRDLVQREKSDETRWKYSAKKLCKLLDRPRESALPTDAHFNTAASTQASSSYLTIQAAAIRLGVYPDAVRSACSCGFFHPGAVIGTHGRTLLQVDAVNHFSKNFVFVGQLSSDLELPRTTLSAKLLHLEVIPVSGPAVDSGLVTIYRRSDISTQVQESLRNLTHYKSKAGRRPKTSGSLSADESTSSANTARKLGVVIHDLKHLEKQGFIKRAITSKTGRHFTNSSVASAEARLKQMISLKVFSAQLGMAPQTFSRRFIQSDFLPQIRLGSKIFLSVEDIERCEKHRRLFMTFCEADEALGAANGHTANLVRLRKLSPLVPGEPGYVSTVRLLHRHDVNAIK